MVFSAWMKASGGGFCLRAHVFLFWKFADEFSTFTSWTWWNLSPNHLLDFSLWTDTMSPLKGITDRLTFSNTPIISTPCIIRLHYFLWKECSSSLSTKKKKKLSPFSSKAAASIKLHMSYLKKKKKLRHIWHRYYAHGQRSLAAVLSLELQGVGHDWVTNTATKRTCRFETFAHMVTTAAVSNPVVLRGYRLFFCGWND